MARALRTLGGARPGLVLVRPQSMASDRVSDVRTSGKPVPPAAHPLETR